MIYTETSIIDFKIPPYCVKNTYQITFPFTAPKHLIHITFINASASQANTPIITNMYNNVTAIPPNSSITSYITTPTSALSFYR